MDPNEYEAEDFLQDPSFCEFCLGTSEEAVNFWKNWISQHPEKVKPFQQARTLYGVLNGNLNPVQFAADRQYFLESMHEHLAQSSGQHPSPLLARHPFPWRKLILYTGTVAAAALLFFFASPLFFLKTASTPARPVSNYQYVQDSKAGERKSFQLADGTKVMLNAGSTIKVSKDFNVSSRELILEGEAFFDVTHNKQKPFIIHTASMDVRVLGTAFNIKAYPSDKTTETSLLKGSVEVTVKNEPGRVVILHPNEKIVLINSQGTISASATSKLPAVSSAAPYRISTLTYAPVDSTMIEVSWTNNKLAFDSDSFEDIAIRLERWYNVSIRFEHSDIRQYKYTGVFDKKTINQVLDALQLSRRFEYTEIDKDGKDQILIK